MGVESKNVSVSLNASGVNMVEEGCVRWSGQ